MVYKTNRLFVLLLLHLKDCQPLEDVQASSVASSTERDFGTVKFPPTNIPGHSTISSLSAMHAKHAKKHQHPAWLVYTSAIPTVFVFVVCVVIIFVKQHYEIK